MPTVTAAAATLWAAHWEGPLRGLFLAESSAAAEALEQAPQSAVE
jgi:hypothetical protein